MNNVYAQQAQHCDTWRMELQRAIDQGHISEIDYRYHKLQQVCEVSLTEMGMVAGALEMIGYKITWNPFKQFQVIEFPNQLVDSQHYFSVTKFDDIEPNHSLKNKFEDLSTLLQNVNIDLEDLPIEPDFIMPYNVILVHRYEGNFLLDMTSLKPLLSYNGQTNMLEYRGGGIFVSNRDGNCIVYRITSRNGKPKLSKIIEKSGNAHVIPVTTNSSFIVLTGYKETNNNLSLYSEQGKLLLDNCQQIEFSPLSRTIILRKNDRYQLYDYHLKCLFPDAEYIYEVWKNDLPFYIIDHAGHRNLMDVHGKTVLSAKAYDDIYIHQSPYALVKKNNQYALIDYLTKAIMIPYQDMEIKQLTPGFWTYMKDKCWQIVDEQNRLVGKVQAKQISMLNDKSKLLIKTIAEHGTVGVADVFGNQIIDPIYRAVQYNEHRNTLIVTQGQTQFETDLNGKQL